MFYKFYAGVFILSLSLLMFAGCGMISDKSKEFELEENLINTYDTVQKGVDYLINNYVYGGEKTENEWNDNVLLEAEIEEYLLAEVPELNEYKKYISEKSDYEAAMIMKVTLKPQKIKSFSEMYYAVYVGEQWETHAVNWDWFYVSSDLENILWYLLPEDLFLTLDEWRSSTYYRKLDD